MVNYIRFLDTGEIISFGTCPDNHIEFQLGFPNYILTLNNEETINLSSQYVLNGKIVDMPIKPSEYHKFDYDIKQWVPDITQADNAARMQRNSLLQESDWTQLPDVPLETKQAWATYRQALRDITNQEGYPFNVIWPTKPE